MKKFDFKSINWKDPKFIFPPILAFAVLFLGYMLYGITQELSSSEETDNPTAQTEIASVPLGDSTSIASKAQALEEVFRQDMDFTAVELANESTRLSADTTIYSTEELALLEEQERRKAKAEQDIAETNKRIEEQNALLAETRRNISSTPQPVSDTPSSLDREIEMYQKILRGEEILTPEQELERKLEAARQEEREKIKSEMNSRETSIVEKVSSTTKSSAFNTIGQNYEANNYIRAMVDQGVSVTVGSRIRFRLLDDIKIQGITVPAGTQLYAIVSTFGDQRVKATVESIVTKGKRVKVSLSVYDRDGIEGFFIPKSSFRDFTKEAGGQALGQNNINFNSSAQSIEGVALQTLQEVYQSASNAISNKIRENKAKIKYNTTIYLINNG